MHVFLKWGLMATLVGAIFAENKVMAQDDNAQQALQQLRLLQQRLSQQGGLPGDPSLTQGADSKGQAQTKNQPSADSQIPLPLRNAPTVAAASSATNASAPANSPGVTESDAAVIESKAFNQMTKSIYPLNPEQVVKLKQIYQTEQYAQTTPIGTPPRPTATSQIVNLSPGSTPPVIRLSQGFVSSLVFLDSTGAPWPIAAYDLGDPSSFNIQWDKTSNTLMIQASKLYNYGNLAVRLKDLNTPVMLTLIPGQKAVDYRVDLRIQGYGPNAKNMPMEEGIPPAASDVLLHVLDGVPPPNSQRLTVNGGDARAWLSHERMYVRTNLTVLSPGWIASMTSADGTHAYEMQKSPVLLVSWHGKVMQLKVEGL